MIGESIVLIHLCDRTGPFSAAHASRIRAVDDLVAAINTTGGIFGASIDLQLANTTGTAEGAQRALARTIRRYGEGPLVLICDPAAEAAVALLLNEDELPALTPGVSAGLTGHSFGLDATPEDHFAFFLDQLRSKWTEWRPEGAPDEIRVAILAWPQELAGELLGEDAAEELEEAQFEIVMQTELPAELNANNFDPIYQARDLNVNVIYTNARGFGLAALLNALQDLGLRERFVVAAPGLAFDTQTVDYLHDPSYADGLLLTSAWAWWSESELPGIQELSKLQAGIEYQDWGYVQMAGAVSVARRALEEAILAEGYENLGPESVAAALMEMEDFPALGGLFVVNYSRNHRSLSELRIWRVEGRMLELVLP